MTTPSVLEIIIMVIIGLLVSLYIVKSIYVMIDKKRHPQKYDKKAEKEQKELDD